MKMRLQEAKQILKRAGYLVRSLNEDTETDDDEYWDEYKNQKLNKKAFDYDARYDSYGYDKTNRSIYLKLELAKLHNLATTLEEEGIEVGEVERNFDGTEHCQLPVRVSKTYKGDSISSISCLWRRRLNDVEFVIHGNHEQIIKEFDTAEEVVDFLKEHN